MESVLDTLQAALTDLRRQRANKDSERRSLEARLVTTLTELTALDVKILEHETQIDIIEDE